MGFSVRGLELFARSRTRPDTVTESPGLRSGEVEESIRKSKATDVAGKGSGRGS
jgi:hypothetical protein